MDEQSIFSAALEHADPADRAAYLNKVCAGDPSLRQRVERLLQVCRSAGSFMEGHPSGREQTVDVSVVECPGTRIGPYKLREQIGEGGFGVVYVAEQEAPVSRKVALKIIKPGMDTKDVIARFEAERQALALMDHPNVAKVLDAGATKNGRPYFAMELVHGLTITEFCDEQKLTNRQRLELFVDVCRAVQHAHQKGIIHRDLKPSNILVTMHDDRPVPKVIDFGVSKALSRKLTDKTVYTGYGQMVGTPLYMSPEQAQMSGLDVDTRSDVYSLGVLLYELLTGTTPFDQETLKEAGFDELRRIIREDEPPRPSDRVSTLNAELLSTACDRRKVDRRSLGQSLRGELDWIVMKPLEKDRNRRYESASAFAADVQRYLNDEPVLACPPSVWYRLGKFARKNRTTTATTAMAILLLVAVAVSGVVIAQRTSERAEQQRLVSERRIAADQKLSDALTVLLRLQSRAEQSGIDDQQAWSAAQQAAERLKLLSENQLIAPPLKKNADAALSAFNRAARDRRIIAALERVRSQIPAEYVEVDDLQRLTGAYRNQFRVTSPGYRAAFAETGIDVDVLPAADVAKWVATQRREVRDALLVALDQWAEYYRRQPSSWLSEAQVDRQKWAEEVVDLADNDAWRRRMRKAIRDKDIGVLVELAESPEVDQQDADTLLLLGGELGTNYVFPVGRQSRPRYAVEFLKKAHRLHPGDYWLVRGIVSGLSHLSGEEYAIEQVQYAAVAAALRPKEGTDVWGQALLRNQQYEEAAQVYRKLIQDQPKQDSRFYVNACAALENQGRKAEGTELLAKALAIQHDDPRWYEWLGDAFQNRDPEQAIVAYRKAVDAAHNLNASILNRPFWYDSALRKLTSSLDRVGRLDEALPLLERRLRETDEVWQHAKRARLLVRLGRWQEAADAYSQLLARLTAPEDEGQWRYRALLVRVLDELNRDEELLEIAAELVDRVPNRLSFDRVVWWSERQAESEVIRNALRRIAQTPKVHGALGFLLCQLGNESEAIAEYRAAIELDAAQPLPHFNLAFCLSTQGHNSEALEHYRRATSLDSTDAVAWLNYARALQDEGRSDEAAAAYREALKRESQLSTRQSTTPWVWFRLAQCLHLSDKDTEAVDAYRQVLIREPTSDEALHNLALSLVRLGREDEAIEALRTALKYAPTEKNHRQMLSGILQRRGSALQGQGELAAALHAYQQSIRLRDDGGGPHNNLGVLLRAEARTDEAVVAFERSVEYFTRVCDEQPDNERAQKNLAIAKNNLAVTASNLSWRLSTAEEAARRDPHRAVELARKAIAVQPDNPNHWNNLGVALYRSGDWAGAADALVKADEMLGGEDRVHRFFLVMAYWRIGEHDRACQCYDEAVAWLEEQERNKNQYRFRAEAEALMGLKQPEADNSTSTSRPHRLESPA